MTGLALPGRLGAITSGRRPAAELLRQDVRGPAESNDSAHTHTMDLRLLEHHIRVQAELPSLVAELTHHYEIDRDDTGRTPREIALRVTLTARGVERGNGFVCVATDPHGALPRTHLPRASASFHLATTLNNWATAHTSAYYVFHAAALCRGAAGMLLPGRSQSGKSTLAATLIRRGFEVLSDEVGAIEIRSGCLHHYPRALALRPESCSILRLDDDSTAPRDPMGTRLIRPADLGGGAGRGLAAPIVVVAPCYQPETTTALHRLKPAEAVALLMEAACFAAPLKAGGLECAIRMATELPCYRLTFSEPFSAAVRIEEVFARACEGRI